MPLYNVMGNPTEIKPEPPKENWASKEIKQMYGTNMSFDNKRVIDVVKDAAKIGGVSPSMLMSSAWQEGMSRFMAENKKDNWTVGEFYNLPEGKDKQFPVDGFQYYGLDTFTDRYQSLKKYLPKDFEFVPFTAENEKGEKVNTAAFKNNRDALIAKAAIIRSEMDTINSYAQKNNIKLDDKALNYFTLSSYNAGFGNAKMMMDQYAQAKDKNAFIDLGETTRKGVHKNVMPRISNMNLVDQIMAKDQKDQEYISKAMEVPALLKAPSKENPLPLFNAIKK
jgi:hypothetical protein